MTCDSLELDEGEGRLNVLLQEKKRYQIGQGNRIKKTTCPQALSDIAGFRPGRRGPFLSGKGPKTIDAQSGLIG